MASRERGAVLFVSIMASAALLLGLSCQPWLIERLFVPDGVIGSPALRRFILVTHVVLLVLGGALAFWRRTAGALIVSKWMLSSAVFLLATAFIDRALVWPRLGASVASPTNPAGLSYPVYNLEYSYHYATNARGLRGEEVRERSAGQPYRIVVVGDSFVEGMGVPLEKTFVSLLDAMLGASIDVIPCGLTGTGPWQQERALLDVCLGYAPDLVIFAIYPNDVTDSPEDPTMLPPSRRFDVPRAAGGLARAIQIAWPTFYALTRMQLWTRSAGDGDAVPVTERLPAVGQVPLANKYLDELERAAASVAEALPLTDVVAPIRVEAAKRGTSENDMDAWQARLPPQLVRAANRGMFNQYILAMGLIAQTAWTQALDLEPEVARKKLGSMLSLLERMASSCTVRGAAVAAMLIPAGPQLDARYAEIWRRVGVETRDAWLEGPSALQTELSRWAAARGLPWLDLTPLFRERDAWREGLYYPLDGHWTAAGHAVAAELVLNWLRERSPETLPDLREP